MKFKNDSQRKAMFANLSSSMSTIHNGALSNMNRFSNDSFMKISTDIKNRVRSMDNRSDGETTLVTYNTTPFRTQREFHLGGDNIINDDDGVIVTYNTTPVYYMEPKESPQIKLINEPEDSPISVIGNEEVLLVNLPEEMTHNLFEVGGENLVSTKKRSVAQLMALGASYGDAVELVDSLGERFSGSMSDIVKGKFHHEKMNSYKSKGDNIKYDEAKLQAVCSGSGEVYDERGVAHHWNCKDLGISKRELIRVEKALVKAHGSDVLDQVDLKSIDWKKDSIDSIIKNLIKNPKFYEGRHIEFSNSYVCGACT
jgi:hypothetical protein